MDFRRFANICLSTFMFSRVTVFLLNDHNHDRPIVCWPKEFWDSLSENWLNYFFCSEICIWWWFLVEFAPSHWYPLILYWIILILSRCISQCQPWARSRVLQRCRSPRGAWRCVFLGSPLSQRMSKLQSDRCDVSPSKRCDFPKSWESWTKNPLTIPCCSSKLKVKPSHVAFL